MTVCIIIPKLQGCWTDVGPFVIICLVSQSSDQTALIPAVSFMAFGHSEAHVEHQFPESNAGHSLSSLRLASVIVAYVQTSFTQYLRL